jgi:uncharacterized peroxidase-related enzyme
MRLKMIEPAAATGRVSEIYGSLQQALGIVPNVVRGLASSPAALEAFVNMRGALAGGALDAAMRERIALTVAEANACEYCLSAHTLLGAKSGLGEAELAAARHAGSSDPRVDAGLRFATSVVARRGDVGDEEIERARAAGYPDGEIAEIVANVAFNVYTNYFNKVAHTTNDFPVVRLARRVA